MKYLTERQRDILNATARQLKRNEEVLNFTTASVPHLQHIDPLRNIERLQRRPFTECVGQPRLAGGEAICQIARTNRECC